MGRRSSGGGWAGPWPGRGAFSYLPPWQRPGWLHGYGRGSSRRWDYCHRSLIYARFPWLPRSRWIYPEYTYPHTSQTPAMSAKDELAALEDFVKNLEAEHLNLEQEIKEVESRIKEMKAATERQSEQGT